MSFWKRLWAFLLNETTVDDKIIAKVNEVKKEVSEAKDVVAVVKPKKKRYYKPKAKKQ